MGKMSYEILRKKYVTEVNRRKEDEAKVADVEELMAQAEKKAQQAVHEARVEAIQKTNAEWEAKLRQVKSQAQDAVQELDKELGQVNKDNARAEVVINRLNVETAALETRVKTLEDELAESKETGKYWYEEARVSQPTITVLTSQVADLRGLLDRVHSRMRKREVQEQTSILNRQAVAQAVPGLRRR